MAVSLLLTTIISFVVFVPAAFLLHRMNATDNPTLRKPAIFFYGGAVWSVIAILQFVVLQLLNLITTFSIAEESSLSSFMQVQTEARTPLFWYIFFISVVGQIILYRGSEMTFSSDTAWDYALFGLGWGVSEYLHRFLFFDVSSSSIQLFLIVYSIGLGTFIGSTIIRIRENSKFIMFAALLKFFGEIGIFGELGYEGASASLSDLYGILGLAIFMAGLSMVVRKFPLEDD